MVYEPKFYKCTECDIILEAVTNQCCDDLICCGKPMELLRANELIALEEKHMPVVKREGSNLTVCVGRVLHPMSREHSILWVEVKSKYSEQRVTLKSGDDPIAIFEVPENMPVTIYSYCNLHGLWKISA
ncbi:MAG: desulfoferrodoxin [Firmicutes bacterium]|nr:desulfoferrodoxin [Bacillota bacterium]